MDPFVRRLVQRLFDPTSGLSRNRHFHTFDNAEGRQALQVSKRLKALAKDIAACHAEGGRPAISRSEDAAGAVTVAIELTRLKSKRTTRLGEAEYELLLQLPGVRAALGQ
ncbi:MAG: hypothetical protein MUC96_11685 [Myxococcaceae bacterium]|jgi:hypothetical protein|nr:hypothetical protein [Myxococcaceae bacterium]